MEEGRLSNSARLYGMVGAVGWLARWTMAKTPMVARQQQRDSAANAWSAHPPWSVIVQQAAISNTRGYRDTDTTHVPVSTVSTTTEDEIVRWKLHWVGLVFLPPLLKGLS